MLRKLFAKKPPKNVRILGSEHAFEIEKNQTILEAALAKGLRYPHDCTVGTCGTCRSRLASGKVDAITPFGYTLSREELEGGFILACQAVPKSDVEIEVDLEPDVDAISCIARIRNIEDLTYDIKRVTWATERPVSFRAGQYMNISWPGGPASRSYSFSTAPTAGGGTLLSTFVRKVPGGAFTEQLFAGKFDESTEFTIDAPHGNFWLREGTGPILLVGGGSGLSPLMSLLENAIANETNRDAILLFGGRSEKDLYCLQEIAAIAKDWKGSFEFRPVLSEEKKDDVRHGMVTEEITEAILALGGAAGLEAYMCGPPPMIDAGVAALTRENISINDIYYDKFTDASTANK